MLKRIMQWCGGIALLILVLVWGRIGIKLLSRQDDVLTEACIGLGCFCVLLICLLYFFRSRWNRKCPFCGKSSLTEGVYCPHCGKKMNERELRWAESCRRQVGADREKRGGQPKRTLARTVGERAWPTGEYLKLFAKENFYEEY